MLTIEPFPVDTTHVHVYYRHNNNFNISHDQIFTDLLKNLLGSHVRKPWS